jgi:hypothetical protein
MLTLEFFRLLLARPLSKLGALGRTPQMTALRYYDKPEYDKELEKAEQFSDSKGKLKQRGATMWLLGDNRERTADEIETVNGANHVAKKRYMVKDEVVERTKEAISSHAKSTGKAFKKGMPLGAHFNMSVDLEPKLLDKYPHLGVCEFAKIPVRTAQGNVIVALYVANFEATIAMKPEEEFFQVTKTDYSEMYFGVAWRKVGDEFELAFDVGKRGLMFQTKDKVKAFDNAVHLSTGVPVSEWKRRIQDAKDKLQAFNEAAVAGYTPQRA